MATPMDLLDGGTGVMTYGGVADAATVSGDGDLYADGLFCCGAWAAFVTRADALRVGERSASSGHREPERELVGTAASR